MTDRIETLRYTAPDGGGLIVRAIPDASMPLIELETRFPEGCPGHAPVPDDWRRTSRPADNGEPAY